MIVFRLVDEPREFNYFAPAEMALKVRATRKVTNVGQSRTGSTNGTKTNNRKYINHPGAPDTSNQAPHETLSTPMSMAQVRDNQRHLGWRLKERLDLEIVYQAV